MKGFLSLSVNSCFPDSANFWGKLALNVLRNVSKKFHYVATAKKIVLYFTIVDDLQHYYLSKIFCPFYLRQEGRKPNY
jgi:hypothetical protein